MICGIGYGGNAESIIYYDEQTQKDAARFLADIEKSSRPDTSDPVRKATRKRVDAWINGERGVV